MDVRFLFDPPDFPISCLKPNPNKCDHVKNDNPNSIFYFIRYDHPNTYREALRLRQNPRFYSSDNKISFAFHFHSDIEDFILGKIKALRSLKL